MFSRDNRAVAFAIGVKRGHTSRVVATVLENVQALQQVTNGRVFAHVPHNPARFRGRTKPIVQENTRSAEKEGGGKGAKASDQCVNASGGTLSKRKALPMLCVCRSVDGCNVCACVSECAAYPTRPQASRLSHGDGAVASEPAAEEKVRRGAANHAGARAPDGK